MKWVLWVMIMTVMIGKQTAAESNNRLAEKLGFSGDARMLIIHADDGGLLRSVNTATQRLLENGSISSASYMMPTPWVYQAVPFFNQCQQCDVGLHITLNSEWAEYRWGATASADQVTSLLDTHRALWKTREQYLQYAEPEQAILEMKAQIDKAFQLGLKPSHIDTHMGTVFTKPEVLKGYVRLAKQYQLIPMLPKWSSELEAYLQARPYYNAVVLKAVLQQFANEGLLMLDYIIPDVGGETLQQRKQRYQTMLTSLKPGLTQVIVHLSDQSDEFDAFIKQQPNEIRRYWDVEILSSPEFQAQLKHEHIKLINWRDLQTLIYHE